MARSPARAVGGALALLTAGAVGVGAVVVGLRVLDRPAPTPVRCSAQVDGTAWHLQTDQAETAALLAAQTVRRDMPARAATIALATGLQESRLRNIDYGDRDSVGIFQQRPSQGWGSVEEIMDPVYSTTAFLDALDRVPGYETMEVTVAAQTVQRSGFPDAYAQHEPRSRAWASALTGHSPAALTCSLPELEAAEGAGAARARAAVLAERAARDFSGAVGATVEEGGAGEGGVGEGGVGEGGAGEGGAGEGGERADVVLDATGLPPDEGRSVWVVAHWAVAVAEPFDVVRVQVGDVAWDRSGEGWAEVPEPLEAGQVRVTVATG